MKKKIVIGLVVLILLIVFGIVIKTCINSKKMLELTYKTNGGVPYNWEYEIKDKSIVECVKTYVVKDENKGGKVGAPIYTNYVFKGKKKGMTTITFRYISVIDGSISNEEKINVKVDKNNNIAIVAIPK